MTEENEQIRRRREKLAALRAHGNAFPNDFRRSAFAAQLLADYGDQPAAVEADPPRVKVAGRLMSRRVMGKASFAHLADMSGQIQLFVQRDALPQGVYNEQFKQYDIGDIVAAEGELFFTRTGELSVRVDQLRLMTKALRPLPEKYHGLADAELRYRQRYVDLIMNARSREVFRQRAAAIRCIREFMVARSFLEVETPMMHPIPGGAVARPFVTHHNALDTRLYLRVAPELYLKRLVVGGFERVFEINRSFRNEGVSTRHNPEFTMLEFYWAYADYRDLIELTEQMMRAVCQAVTGGQQLTYQGMEIDFSRPAACMTMAEAILRYNPELTPAQLDDRDALLAVSAQRALEVEAGAGVGKLQTAIFEQSVEHRLVEPTFITAYPVEVSPLSRRSDAQAQISDRFEFFVAGREIANGFSELNDAEDQAARFRQQMAERGADDQAGQYFDADYIRALEYGMPPTAGQGIGIDRLVMLLTDSASIRDVLLFPYMRPEGQTRA